jgi:hypothetical protein
VLLLFLTARRLHHQMKNARTLMATIPPMTPPATATVDWTALLFELEIGGRTASAELVSLPSGTAVSVGVCGGSMVVRSGVAAGPSGRPAEEVSTEAVS